MNRNGLSRRGVLKLGATVAGALAMPTILSGRVFAAKGTKTLNMQLGWLANGNQLGEIVAKQMGYFEEEGIDFRLQPGGPNIDGLAMVASGQYEMGVMPSSPSIMLAASQHIPIRCFGVGFQEHPFAFYSLPKAPVHEPRDLIGKRVGIPQTTKILVTALLKKHGIPEDQVKVQITGSELTPLLTGQVDVITAWQTNTTNLKILGPDAVRMRLWDVGIKLYANNYYAHADRLKEDPELYAKFMKASSRGWALAREDSAKAAGLLVKELPNLDLAGETDAAAVAVTVTFNADTKEYGWGHFRRDLWEDQIALYDELGQFSAGAPKLDNVIDGSILAATKDDRAKIG
ncbi:MAG: ABC transporter substrate-binding protein [Rhizobiales bacterium]|nr:ABC transporter substrate-binding protein [Hyphomicrobiales bacterium]